jgi:hypothetical protein
LDRGAELRHQSVGHVAQRDRERGWQRELSTPARVAPTSNQA